MAGRYLGEAFFTVSPDTRLFRTQADIGIRKAIAGISPNVRIGADTRSATAAVASFQARVKALGETLGTMRADIKDDRGAEAKLAGLQARVITLAKSMQSMTASADTKKLDAQIAAETARLKTLKQQMSDLQADANTAAAAAKIAALQKQSFHLSESLGKLTARVDIKAAETKIKAIDAELRVLKDNAEAVKLAANKTAIMAQITAVQAAVAKLKVDAADIRLGANIDPAKLLAAEAALLGLESAAEKLAPAAVAGDVALGVLGKAVTGTGRGWGFLTRSIALFGGVLNRVMPVVLASVAIWHVLADAIIEIAAVWIPATLAVGAFAIAASDAAVEIQRRMQAVHTVMDATGQSVPPMTRAMENLHAAVRPEVYQLFGDALRVVNSRTGTFAQVAKATGTVIDQLAARMVFAVTSGNKLGTSTTQLSAFWKTAITDVSKLGDSIGNLFGVFGNLFKAIPGFAAGLLTIGDDFTKILESASAAAVPVLKWVLLLHGYILYTGLAATASLAFIGGLANLARQFVTFAASSVLAGVGALKSFGSALTSIGLALAAYVESIIVADGASATFAAVLAPLAANPMIWVAVVAVALGALALAIGRSKDAAQQFNDTVQQTIANAQLSNVVTVIQSAQAQTAVKLADSNVKLNQALAEQGKHTGQASRSWGLETAAVYNATKAHQELVTGMGALDSQQRLVSGRFADLTKKYGGSTAALGLLNAAGITGAQITSTQGHAWAQALIQIDSTVQAYKAMGTQSGTLGNDLDVLGRTVTDQYTSIQKLNQAWGTFITDVTGTQGSFDTVAQGFETLDHHSGTLKLSLGKLKAVFIDASTATAGQVKVASATAAVATATDRLNKLQASGKGTALQLAAAHARLAAAQGRLTIAQQGLSSAQMEGKSAIDALTPAGIALNQAFGDQVGNLDKLFASWRTAGVSGGQFTSGVKAGIAPLLKYAAGSQEATAQLVALAEEAGYQGPVSMQALTKWLGNTKDATQRLKDTTNTATVQEALLTGAMQSQGDFIASQLLGDINNAALNYYGVAKAASAYGTAVAQSGKGSDAANKAMVTAVSGIVQSEQALGDNTSQMAAVVAKAFGLSMPDAMKLVQKALDATVANAGSAQGKFELFAINGLRFTKDQADQLWKKFGQSNLGALAEKAGTTRDKFDSLASKGLAITRDQADKLWLHLRQQYLDTLASKGDITRDRFIKLAHDGLGLTTTKAQELWDKLNRQRLTDAATKADATKSSFEKLAAKLGYTRDQADTLWGSLHRLTASGYTANVKVNAQGYVNVNGFKISAGAYFSPHAEGGFISGGSPGKDSVPAMLMPGEVVVPTSMVRQGAVDHLRGALPGFAAGGTVRHPRTGIPGFAYGGQVPAGRKVGDTGDLTTNFPMQSFDAIGGFLKNSTARIASAATKAFAKYVEQQTAALSGSGSAIVSYARSFLGKIPYVFGGNSLSGGIDCSGFTQAVYSKFGIHAPRTSEAQYGWATKSGPVPGGLAFYVSPAGGPPPGHVAIVQDSRSVISQGGGMGPAIESLHFLPLMGTGVPKGGLPQGAGGGGNGAIGSGGAIQAIAMALLRQYGWGNQWNAFNSLENAEAGWRLDARNPSSGAYGLAQFINGPSEYFQYGGNPNTALGQLTAMDNYIACVPLDGRILTRDSWKTYSQVKVGDETVGYDHVAGRSAWTKVTAVHHYEDAPVTRLSSNRVDLRSTPNHRWLTEKNIQAGERTYRREEFTETRHIGTRHRIRLAASHNDGSAGLPVSLAEAELLGWIAGDGHIRYPTPNSVNASVYQSEAKPKQLASLRVLLENTPHSEYTRPPVSGRAPIRQFRLRSPYVRDLFNRSQYESDLELMVLRMSTAQREAFAAGLLEADGYLDKKGTWTFCQNDGPVLRAFTLAAYLTGHWCHVTDSAGQKHVRLGSPYVGSGSGFHREDLGLQPVWCVTTELGSWTVEQSGQVFLTGNSRYPSGPNQAWAHELAHHWYGKGGRVPGMAAGGDPAAAFRSGLRSAQGREYHDYSGFRQAELSSLHTAKTGSYLSGHRATITGELGTLAKRQSAEEAAYDAVFHKGAAKAVMSHLNTTLKAVAVTTHDKGLSYSGPGGHPGWLHGLQDQLAGLERIATGPVPAGARTAPHGPKLSQAAFMARLKSLQSAEYHDYLGLSGAFKAGLRHPAKRSWLYAHRGQLGKDLAGLRKLQSAEEAGYDNIRHHGTSLPDLGKETGRVNAELGALRAGELSHLPGGHPGWVKGLRGRLADLSKLLAVQPFNAPWMPKNLGASHTAPGGVLQFDTGRGVLRPGMNLAWNGTGRDEPLSSSQAGAAGGTITLEVVSGSSSDFDQFMLTMIRRYVRVRGGGNVQVAFGRNHAP